MTNIISLNDGQLVSARLKKRILLP